eukprot:8747533-Alexandrium_andersonii.AAC.1
MLPTASLRILLVDLANLSSLDAGPLNCSCVFRVGSRGRAPPLLATTRAGGGPPPVVAARG